MVAVLVRREDWPERLAEALDRHASAPGAWGRSDCYMLAADCVLAMTGVEPWPQVRGRYRSASGAARQLRRHGFRSLEQALAAAFPRVPVLRARRGDLGLVSTPDGPACVVVTGVEATGKSMEGIRRVPVSALLAAFRVG